MADIFETMLEERNKIVDDMERDTKDWIGAIFGQAGIKLNLLDGQPLVPTPYGDALPYTYSHGDTGRNYTTPFMVNVYGWEEDGQPEENSPYIGQGKVLGVLPEGELDGGEPMPVIELIDHSGATNVAIGLFLGIIPIEEDSGPHPDAPRLTYKEYMGAA